MVCRPCRGNLAVIAMAVATTGFSEAHGEDACGGGAGFGINGTGTKRSRSPSCEGWDLDSSAHGRGGGDTGKQEDYEMKRAMLLIVGCVCCLGCLSMWHADAHAGELTVYTEEYAPWNFTKDGEVTGMATEMVRELMKRTGKTYPIQSVPWSRGFKAVRTDPDTVLFCTVRSEEREKLGLQWVGPLGMLRSVLIQKKGAGHTITKLEDAKRVGGIGVYADDIFEEILIDAGFENLVRANDPVLTMRMLVAGQVDLVMIDEGAALMIAQSEGFEPSEYEVAFVYDALPMCIAFSKDTDAKIVAEWDNAYQTMVKDGTIKTLTEKYFGVGGAASLTPEKEKATTSDAVTPDEADETPPPEESLPPVSAPEEV